MGRLWFLLSTVLLLLSSIESDQALSFCRNTVQGRYLISDDRGYTCDMKGLDSMSGCCPSVGQQFQCQGCNLESRCCNSYEYCVSCCLNPNKTSSGLATKVKVAQQSTASTYKNVFDFCLGRCRHNSASVVHENAYANVDHHCFSLPWNASVDHLRLGEEVKAPSISVVISRQGQSCDAACKMKGKICKLSELQLMNNCASLRKYFSCKGSCVSSTGVDQPAEVIGSAPRHLHPGVCIFNANEKVLSCQSSHPYMRRLCPCSMR